MLLRLHRAHFALHFLVRIVGVLNEQNELYSLAGSAFFFV